MNGIRKAWAGVALAAVLWFVMFSPWTAPKVNFWYMMTFSGIVLTVVAACCNRGWTKDVRPCWQEAAAGMGIAFVLWWVFWTGDKVSGWLFSFERPQVEMIYAMKRGTSPTVIALLLLLIIGPAEEIFWRGFVQRTMMRQWGANVGLVVATACYTAVHIPSLNFMLVMAALVVGACWGLLYRLFPRHLAAIIVSHAVWDACAFIIFPF